jgi:hypothetical protein
MPISSAVDHQRRLITHTLNDPLMFGELQAAIDQQWADALWTYAVLYDARTLTDALPLEALQRLSAHIDVIGGGRPRGPVGIVIPARAEMLRTGIAYASGAGPTRDSEVMMNEEQLTAWLARHAIRRIE